MAVIGIGLGLLVSHSSAGVSVAIIVAFIALAAVRSASKVTSRAHRLSGFSTAPTPDDGRFRTARWLVYAGLATSCLLRLRLHGVTFSDGLFLCALGIAALEDAAKPGERGPVLPRAVWGGIVLFVMGGTISTLAESSDKLASFGVILRVFYLVAAWLWLGAVCLRTREHLWTALKWWVISAATCGAWAVGQKYAHLPGSLDAGRFAGLADHVNDLGSLSACALVPALALAYRQKRWALAVIGVGGGLALSGSIGGGLAALIALAVGLISRELTRPTLIVLAVGGAALLLAGSVLGTTAIDRFSTSTNASAPYQQDTFETRLRGYETAWRRIIADPVIGTGLDLTSARVYDPTNATYYQVHNLFVGQLYDSGILGFAGIVILIAVFARSGWRLVISSPDRYLALALFGGFVAYLGTEMSEPSLYKRYSLVPALLIIALRAVVLRLHTFDTNSVHDMSNGTWSLGAHDGLYGRPVTNAGAAPLPRGRTVSVS